LHRKYIRIAIWLVFLYSNIATVKVITPNDPDQRGCCLALKLSCSGEEVCKRMLKRGIAVSDHITSKYAMRLVSYVVIKCCARLALTDIAIAKLPKPQIL